ncbi:MAG TPA: kelch repeat-containing protein [Candidatus Limnocylindrales bacterium]|nr:kelch repeat-containing protein [Candidatus Limnocylindrales bacterium]
MGFSLVSERHRNVMRAAYRARVAGDRVSLPLRLRLALAAVAVLAACAGPGASPPGASGAPDAPPSPTPAATATTAGRSPTTGPTPSAGAPAWAALTVVGGPKPREDHTWTVDAEGGSAWLFGGRDRGTVYDDLWRYDLAADRWQAIQPRGMRPAGRFGHTATWVPDVGLVVWSGQAGADFFADLWAFDPAAGSWRELAAGGARPAPRYGACAALGPDGSLWISHGFTDTGRFADTRAYDFAAGRWSDETPAGTLPVKRCLHDCLWAADGRLLLYGGQTDGVASLGDLWALPPDGTWQEIAAGPPPRRLYGLATVGARAWLFGGGGREGLLGDLWTLDLASLGWRQETAAGAPPARSGSTLVHDAARGRLLLFGGLTADGASADTWALSGID